MELTNNQSTQWSNLLTLSLRINFLKVHHSSFPQPIRMQYVVNFTSMQYMSTLVNTGAESKLSTKVACGSERVKEIRIIGLNIICRPNAYVYAYVLVNYYSFILTGYP